MTKWVFVVTDSELGWDCVVGVFDNEEAAEACAGSRGNGITSGTVTEMFLESEYEE